MMRGEAVITEARKFLGALYVWKGKGKSLWTPKGLQLHAWVGQVFDCSGLVTCALKAAGGPDLRATHSAQTMFDEFDVASDDQAIGVLRFYGKSRSRVTHVAICTGRDGRGGVNVLEAAGGDETTTSPVIAAARKAFVREGLEFRRDYLGARVMP